MGVSLYLDHLAFPDMGDDPAAPMATKAGGSDLFKLFHHFSSLIRESHSVINT
jgi:hypothetical protein